MKKLMVLFVALALFACSTETETPLSTVVFKGNLSYKSGTLKSFNPLTWEHYLNPEKVTVTLTNKSATLTLVANSSQVFFSQGTDPWFVPYGTYDCVVTGGGWGDRIVGYAYYNWTIKDTVITINSKTNLITFDLDKTPALIVREQDSPIDVHYGSFKMDWYSRYDTLNVCDYMYVVPNTYTGVYGASEQPVSLKADEYVYFLVDKQVTTVVLDSMVGDTVSF